MNYVESKRDGTVAVVVLRRGRVNAINGSVVKELRETLQAIEEDPNVEALVLTGDGNFFSFGFDVPELYPLSPDEFTAFLEGFAELYTELFVYPKAVVAALNGHAIAGGCMLALACDRRVMVNEGAKIALNEVTFGSSLPAGSVEMLVACVGQANAERIALEGTMLLPDQAEALGLIDRIVPPEDLISVAIGEARRLGSNDARAFASIKGLLRQRTVEKMRAAEGQSILDFVDVWYSDSTRRKLEEIVIRE